MLKRHKILFIILGLGALYLIYLLYKNYQAGASAAAGQAAALDTSNVPTIISTGGGGGLAPFYQQSAPQTFDATIPGTAAADNTSLSATQAAVTAPAVATVMPGTSSSGVPAHTDQAQEFNTNQPMMTPGGSNGMSSFYASAQQLPYQQINQSLVADTSGPGALTGASHPDLTSFLQQDTLSWETNPGTNAQDFSSALVGEASGYCTLHPEACAGVDQSALISAQTGAYNSFMAARNAALQPQTGGYQLPAGAVAPSGVATATVNAQGQQVWLAANQLPAAGSGAPANPPPSGPVNPPSEIAFQGIHW